jgi:hypothetical protein
LPIFCRYNNDKMSEAVSALIAHLEPMVNKIQMNFRQLALKAFSELINYCRDTKIVIEKIKKTRIGLSRIALDYVRGLSKRFTTPNFDANGAAILLNPVEKAQLLKTL